MHANINVVFLVQKFTKIYPIMLTIGGEEQPIPSNFTVPKVHRGKEIAGRDGCGNVTVLLLYSWHHDNL